MCAPSSSQPRQAIVSLKDVSFSRGNRKIFDAISVDIYQGDIVAVMGPSGTGKTTLMKLITGQLQPDTGQVLTLGQPVNRLSNKALMQLRHRMSMLFQSGALFSDMTVADNVAFPLREKSELDTRIIDTLVKMKLHAVGLRGAGPLMPSELSGGMARRAALARAIIRDPELMIYDEPFTGQDPISLGMLALLIRNLNDYLNMTSVVVSHDVHEVSKIADKILLIADSHIIAYEKPQVLYDSSDAFVQQFMHANVDGPVPFHYPAADYIEELKHGFIV